MENMNQDNNQADNLFVETTEDAVVMAAAGDAAHTEDLIVAVPAETDMVISEAIEAIDEPTTKSEAASGTWQTRMVWHPTLGLQPRYTYVDAHGRCLGR